MENQVENQIKDDLSFESIFLITEMLEKMNVENFVDIVEKKLTDFDSGNPEFKELRKKKFNDDLTKDELLSYKVLEIQKRNLMIKEALKFILSKLHYAKQQIFLIVADFKNITEDEAKKINLKKLIPIMKDLLMSGVWDVIMDTVNFKDKDKIFEDLKTDLKKTL